MKIFIPTDTDRRMNLRLSEENADNLRVLARAFDTDQTQIANAAIFEYAKNHGSEIREAKALFDRFSS